MEIHYGNLSQLQWLWLIPLCVVLAVFATIAQRRQRRRFASPRLLDRLMAPATNGRRIATTALFCLVLAMLVGALVDVRWGKVWSEVPQKGIEVVFVLDVSRSMLAEDTTPNRLTRAKQQIKDTIDEMAGDRVGLVVFAGEVRQQIPMTSHYDDFKQTLDSVGPHSVRRGGSRLGDAIQVAANAFLTKTSDHKAMVILTDGEDQESDPVEAAKHVYDDQGIRIFTIGLGDMDQGARIPVQSDRNRRPDSETRRPTTGTYVEYQGQQVWSKLNGEILRQIATTTEGAYIPAGTKRVDMADVYHGYIADVPQQEFDTARINRYEARFQIFLAVAVLALMLEIALATWPRRRKIERSASNLSPESEILVSGGHQPHRKEAA